MEEASRKSLPLLGVVLRIGATQLAGYDGLCVMFPVDYRYGWDLAHPEHRRLLNEIGAEMSGPDVSFYSPSCRPWSIPSRWLVITWLQAMVIVITKLAKLGPSYKKVFF